MLSHNSIDQKALKFLTRFLSFSTHIVKPSETFFCQIFDTLSYKRYRIYIANELCTNLYHWHKFFAIQNWKQLLQFAQLNFIFERMLLESEKGVILPNILIGTSEEYKQYYFFDLCK